MTTPSPLEAIFFAALEKGSSAERAAYLDEACADDRDLRDRVERMLAAQVNAGSFLEVPAQEMDRTIDQPITEKPGTQIGPYKLLQQLGEGGMGVVYMAEQKEPVRRRVALKIIKPGMDTHQVIARFEAERQALAMMDHPNIAKVLDAGATESGRPYFVMELVNGLPVTQYCDEEHLTPRERLELFVPICQAVQHAHQKGIIHRDLKPSNVLVALYDGQAVPKVIDFGVAKATSQTLTEKTMFTQLGQIVGTLEYMSPEQAQRNQLDIDTRSDIYSLGVLLYELLTGDTPFDRQRLRSAAFDEMLRIIREEEPSKPSTKVSSSEALPAIAANRRVDAQKLGSTIRGELDWIVMKAMEKDRARRYETASKFAEDVQHYLNDEAVVACPPSRAYRIRKFASRHKAPLSIAAVVALSLVLGIAGTAWQAVNATRQRDRAVAAEAKALSAETQVVAALKETQVERDRAVDAEKASEQRRREAEKRREEAEEVISLLGELIGSTNPIDIKGPQYSVLQLLDDFSTKLDGHLTEQPAVEATVRLMVSDVYNQFRTNTDQGLRHAERAYALRRELYGDTHELTIRAERDKAIHMLFLRSDSNRRAEGREILKKIVEMNPTFMQKDHAFRLRTRNAALIAASRREMLTEYPLLLEDAIANLGPDDPTTVWIRNNYADVLLAAGEPQKAELLLRQAIQSLKRTSRADSPNGILVHVHLARALIARGDDDTAREILLQNFARARQHFGEAHNDTIGILQRLMQFLYERNESQAADELFADFSDRLRGTRGVPRLTASNSLAARAVRGLRTPTEEKLFDLAAELFLQSMADGHGEPASLGKGTSTRLVYAAIRNRRPDLVMQVASAAWNTYGVDTPQLGISYATFRRARWDPQLAAEFLAKQMTPNSALFQQADRDRDGTLAPVELVTLIGQGLLQFTDRNGDDKVSKEEAGETLWNVISAFDKNDDGSVDRQEYMTVLFRSQFDRMDASGDGYLTVEETRGVRLLPSTLFQDLDSDGDSRLSQVEYLKRSFANPLRRSRIRSRVLTPTEQFTKSDVDADDRVTKEEAEDAFWKSIADFDANGDNAVDLAELDAGLRKKSQASRRRLLALADEKGNKDGKVTSEELGGVWKKYERFDTDGNKILDEQEMLRAAEEDAGESSR